MIPAGQLTELLLNNMLRNLLLLVLLCFAGSAISQISFFKLYGGDEYDYGRDMVQLADSGYLITGQSGSFRIGHSDAFLLKVDKNGGYEWSAPYGSAENDMSNDLVYIENHGIFMVGSSNGTAAGDFDLWVAFTDVSGNLMWERTYEAENWEEGVEAALTSDSGLVVGVNRSGDATNGWDFSLLRLSPVGDTVWSQEYAFEGDDKVNRIENYNDSMFLIASNRFDTVYGKKIAHLMMLHENGTILWQDTLGTPVGEEFELSDFFVSNDTLFGIGTDRQADTIAADLHYFRYFVQPGNNYPIADFGIHSADDWYGDVITNYTYSGTRRYGAYRADGFWTSPGGPDLHVGRHYYTMGWETGVGYAETVGPDQAMEAIPTLDGGAAILGYMSGSGGANVALIKIGPGEVYPQINGVTYVNKLVGQEELAFLNRVHVYPNPAEDVVYVQSDDTFIDAYELVTIGGSVAARGTVNSNGAIATSNLDAGVYFLRLSAQGEPVGIKQVILR